MGSFKVRLAAYFLLIALLPFAAAFHGFHSLAKRSETRRVDAVLHASLRASLAAYAEELAGAERRATSVARSPELQAAFARRDPAGLRRVAAAHRDLRLEAGPVTAGPLPPTSATRGVTVIANRRLLGEVTAAVRIDSTLVRRLETRAGLESSQRLVFIRGDRVLASADATGRLAPLTTRPRTVQLGGRRVRALASAPLDNPAGARLALLAPQRPIDQAAAGTERRLQATLLVALAVLLLIAYFEGRAIVRTLRRLVDAAHSIALGKLDRRVEVDGRDEFGQLGHAFNEMADQLQARMRELEEERRRLREATMRFGEALAATHDLDGLLRAILETAVDATGASGGLLVGEGGEIVRKGDPAEGTQKLELPLTAGRESFGTLMLSGAGFDQDDYETANWLVGHGVIALENARLHRTVQRQALVDGLTGLANRRLCEAALEREVSRADRFVEPLSLILADLDNFKAINDRHGHPTGDEVLREFARTLQECVREIDLAGRWGGEEFAIVLPGTDLAGAIRLAERIRAGLTKLVVVAADGTRIGVTASFGVAEFTGSGTAGELLSAADAALYTAKRHGKNRVVAAGNEGLPAENVPA